MIKNRIIETYKKKVLFTTHAIDMMNSPDRMVLKDEINEIIENGKVIEDYPDDKRGHSCLIGGKTHEEREIHIVCAPKEDYLAIITVYLPDEKIWKNIYNRR